MKNTLFAVIFIIAVSIPAMTNALTIGDRAPGFEALSTHGTVILSEFKGKKNVVLALYYADFTPV